MRNSAASLPATSCFFCVQPEDRRRIPAGSQGPGIPNPQIPYENLPSNAVSHEILMISQLRPTGLFYIMNALPVLSVKSGLIAFIYPELCFYDLFHKFRRLADQKNFFPLTLSAGRAFLHSALRSASVPPHTHSMYRKNALPAYSPWHRTCCIPC